jgi:hypothetical protein
MRLKSSHAAKLEDDAELVDRCHIEQVHPTLTKNASGETRNTKISRVPCPP